MKLKIIVPGLALSLGILLAILGFAQGTDAPHTFKLKRTSDIFVSPEKVSSWILSGNRDFVLLDLRSAAAYKKEHIKDAVNCASCHSSKSQGVSYMKKNPAVNLSKKIVVYSQSGLSSVTLPRIMQDNIHIYELAGGYENWQKKILAPVKFDSSDQPDVIAQKKKRLAVRNYFLGKTIEAPKIEFKPVKMSQTHKSRPADEGC